MPITLLLSATHLGKAAAAASSPTRRPSGIGSGFAGAGFRIDNDDDGLVLEDDDDDDDDDHHHAVGTPATAASNISTNDSPTSSSADAEASGSAAARRGFVPRSVSTAPSTPATAGGIRKAVLAGRPASSSPPAQGARKTLLSQVRPLHLNTSSPSTDNTGGPQSSGSTCDGGNSGGGGGGGGGGSSSGGSTPTQGPMLVGSSQRPSWAEDDDDADYGGSSSSSSNVNGGGGGGANGSEDPAAAADRQRRVDVNVGKFLDLFKKPQTPTRWVGRCRVGWLVTAGCVGLGRTPSAGSMRR